MASTQVLASDTPPHARTRPFQAGSPPRASQARLNAALHNARTSSAAAGMLPPSNSQRQQLGSSLLKTRPGLRKEEEQNRRDENMRVICDDIPLGPLEFPANPRDPQFNFLEPYSGIRLRQRSLPFDQFQRVMHGRRFISPSTLYSLVEQCKDPSQYHDPSTMSASRYDLPLDGDWVVIGVLAEKSPIRMTRGGQAAGNEDAVLGDEDEDGKRAAIMRTYRPNNQPRKYMAWKLVDFGNASSVPGADSRTRGTDSGDCVLSLTLFAADEEPEEPKDDESRNHVRQEIRDAVRPDKKTWYHGGSKGAFEKYWKEREGTVVAIVSPRIMCRSMNNGFYNQYMLSISPTDLDSIYPIGRSSDYAQCQAHRKDGTRCQSWVDTRSGAGACEFHVEQRVIAARKGRQEFAVGTSGSGWARKNQGSGTANNADADDIFSRSLGKRKGKGKKSKRSEYKFKDKRQSREQQPSDWENSLSAGMDAGFASSSSGAVQRSFVVEGAGTWVERSGRIQADGSGPKVGDIHFDVSAAYGRDKDQRKERARKQAETDQLEGMLKAIEPSVTARPPPRQRQEDSSDSEYEQGDEDWMLQGSSTAAQALREAKRVLAYKQELAAAAAAAAAAEAGAGGKKRQSRLFKTSEDALLAAAMSKNAKERHRATATGEEGSGQKQRPRWAFSAEAIQKMGFDPLAGAPGRAGAVPVWKENESVEQKSKSTMRKLSHNKAGAVSGAARISNGHRAPASRPSATGAAANRLSAQTKPQPLAAPFSRAGNTPASSAATKTASQKKHPRSATLNDSGSDLDWGDSGLDEEDQEVIGPGRSHRTEKKLETVDEFEVFDDDDAWEALEQQAREQETMRKATQLASQQNSAGGATLVSQGRPSSLRNGSQQVRSWKASAAGGGGSDSDLEFV
ncbi:hypothetical protein OC861_001351 [Tilletia horrida]|nr:hypothetical protein OC861_001351 [Tilletia horrida]